LRSFELRIEYFSRRKTPHLASAKENTQQPKEKTMKRITILTMSVLLALAVTANAQQPDDWKRCSNETLRGSYGGTIAGTRPAPSVITGGLGSPGQLEQAVGIILWAFDGRGNFTQTLSGKGTISGPILDLHVSGTYSVNPDCTATVKPIVPGLPPSELRMVIVDGGKEFRTFVVSPQSVMVVGHARKVWVTPAR
jgi:hypothetical protein